MIVNSYEINEAHQVMPLRPETAAAVWEKGEAKVWIDIEDYESAELEEWMETVGLTEFSRRLCREAKDRSGFYPLKNEVFMVIPVLVGTEPLYEVGYVTFLCQKNLLCTFHRKAFLSPQQLSTIEDSQAWLPEGSIAGMVSTLMLDLSLDCLRRTVELRDSVLALDQQMEREPDSVEAEGILELQASVLTLRGVVSDQLPCVQALSATDKPFFSVQGSHEYVNSALINLQSADGSLDRLDKRIDGLRDGFQMHAQDKTNRRLNFLTVLSAIFMPSTLLAGIWGMNFETMPELKYPLAYPIALGFMALIGSGMYFFFRRTGWFD